MVAPLSDLTETGQPKQDVWTEQCEKALRTIQALLPGFPMLILPDLSEDFLVRTDASSTGMGAVLPQEREGLVHPVLNASRMSR